MGLDAVELMMEVEETFAIKVMDDDAVEMRTVGDLYRYILQHMPPEKTARICLSAVTFYRLRQAFKKLGGVARLRPRDAITMLLPQRGRRRFWSELQQTANLSLPPLRRPGWLVWLSTLLVVAASALVGAQVYQATHSQSWAAVAGIASAIVGAVIASIVTLPAAVCPPHATLRSLAAATLGLNYPRLREEYRHQAVDVWDTLKAILVNQLGVPADRVTPEASFVNDLGLS